METITAQHLLDILNNTYEIPKPELAELCFYFEKESGEVVDLKLKSIGAFNISTDITFTFVEYKEPVIIKPSNGFKPNLRNA